MASTPNRPSEPTVLQRSISAALWQVRKATADHDALAARRAGREMNALLDQLAGCMITDRVGRAHSLPQ